MALRADLLMFRPERQLGMRRRMRRVPYQPWPCPLRTPGDIGAHCPHLLCCRPLTAKTFWRREGFFNWVLNFMWCWIFMVWTSEPFLLNWGNTGTQPPSLGEAQTLRLHSTPLHAFPLWATWAPGNRTDWEGCVSFPFPGPGRESGEKWVRRGSTRRTRLSFLASQNVHRKEALTKPSRTILNNF